MFVDLKKFVLPSFVALCLCLAACGGSSKNDDGNEDGNSPTSAGNDGNGSGEGRRASERGSQSLSYDFTFNGCKTGKQTFNSQAKLCEGLKSQNLNHRCAVEMRQRYFAERNCPGTWELTE